MTAAFDLPHDRHVALFAALTEMTRAFAQLMVDENPNALARLDEGLATGATTRITFTLGAAGPLSCAFHAVRLDGGTLELVNIDAPPSSEPFRFNPP